MLLSWCIAVLSVCPMIFLGYADYAWATGEFFTGSIIQRRLCASTEFSTDPKRIAISNE